MPRRTGWFLVAETPDGYHMAHPVDTQTQAWMVLERLASHVPSTSTWYCEWRNG